MRFQGELLRRKVTFTAFISLQLPVLRSQFGLINGCGCRIDKYKSVDGWHIKFLNSENVDLGNRAVVGGSYQYYYMRTHMFYWCY